MADLQAQFESECRARRIPFEIEETRDSLVITIVVGGAKFANATGLTGDAKIDVLRREAFFSAAIHEIRDWKVA